MNPEKQRLTADKENEPWRKWGPYLSERQWGTVREDYSPDGDAWSYTTHEMARSKTNRWGEDGIGGICDNLGLLNFSPAFWNGKDPILKERLFGLSGHEGNHGEDVKECYYYIDNTPSHSYMKMLYKYPQNEFPYSDLVNENKKRGKTEPEYELIDTGIFDNDKYFDVFIEYAKAGPEDILIKITGVNRGNEKAFLNLVPQLVFRNTWSWGYDDFRPVLKHEGKDYIEIDHMEFACRFYFEQNPELLFCDNCSNVKKLYGVDSGEAYFKDGINNYIVNNDINAVNPSNTGTKAGLSYKIDIEPHSSAAFRFRLSKDAIDIPFENFDEIFSARQNEADEFYNELQSGIKNEDEKKIQRQAYSGLLWCKQFYYYDVPEWLEGDPGQPAPPPERLKGRNSKWIHLNNLDIISMPDNWEFPWYASWDLAFHCIALAGIDSAFAKSQLTLLTKEWYMQPNGQLPAYEWNFGDTNPPVHAWASLKVYFIDKDLKSGKGDTYFLESVFHKLLLNFTWWVNRKDMDERNIFQGGFLGLDNIGVFDRSKELPGGGHLEQTDGTSWMAMYSLNMMRMALELADSNHVYEDLATKFLEHFLYIAGAMTNIGGEGINLWNDEDEFFYDVLHGTDGSNRQIKIRSMVGLIPFFAVEVIGPEIINRCPKFAKRMDWFLNYREDLAALVSHWHIPGKGESRLFSLLRGHRMKALLKRILDEAEFLSDYGVRSLSKYHKDNPYIFNSGGTELKVQYEPGESETGIFGGNSNWRGPVWFPVNYLIIESLRKFHDYYGDDFKVEYPAGSGKFLSLAEIADGLCKRLVSIFSKNENRNRPVSGDNSKLQSDPNFNDNILFYEYFHGDSGKGLGASHQTGWTSLVSCLISG